MNYFFKNHTVLSLRSSTDTHNCQAALQKRESKTEASQNNVDSKWLAFVVLVTQRLCCKWQSAIKNKDRRSPSLRQLHVQRQST
eukprot:6488275-Amphidinium_carterae.1